MAKLYMEELWQHPGNPGMIIATTCGTVTGGKLVMNGGAAQELRKRIPDAPGQAALAIYRRTEYGFIPVSKPEGRRVGWGIFQTRNHFDALESVELIARSALDLEAYAREHPKWNFRMNLPGLKREIVEPLLANIPDNVIICYREEGTPVKSFSMSEIFPIVEAYVKAGKHMQAISYLSDLGFTNAEEQVESIKERVVKAPKE